MERQNEKQPVDNLFARKLKTMSLPPRPDGFARLQARMEQGIPGTKVMFWRNSANRRYIAVAACLLLACLFGWLYLSTETPTPTGAVVAVNEPAKHPVGISSRSATDAEDRLAETSPGVGRKTSAAKSKRVIQNLNKPDKQTSDKQANDSRLIAGVSRVGREEKELPRSMPNTALQKRAEQLVKLEPNVHPVDVVNDKETVATVSNPVPIAERVLVVTIAEPQVLSIARQATASIAVENVASTTDKPDRESKTAGFWNQMKRLKQNEIFARKDVANDELGLLGRAYSGLKQSLDKDKSVKQ